MTNPKADAETRTSCGSECQPPEVFADPHLSTIEELRGALEPFAAFADPRNKVPRDYVITAGSLYAKTQITMGNCYDARAALSRSKREAQ